MKELWEQAILPYNLPLTLALGLVIVFWSLTLIGAFGVDTLDLDLPEDGEPPGLTDLPGVMTRFLNAGYVPLTVVLSILVLAMWVATISFNYWFNPSHSTWLGLVYFFAAFVLGVVVTKAVTQPLVPLMRRLKEAENAKPVVGEIGFVRSIELSDVYGQVEVIREDGAPAILNAKLSEGSEPVPRGTQIAVISMDTNTGVYLVRPLPPTSPETLD